MVDVLGNILEHPIAKSIFATIALVFSYLFGEFDLVIEAMLCAMVADFILGFGIAVWEGKFSKVKFWKGLIKGMTFGAALIIGNLADLLIFHQQVEWGVQNFFIVYIGINELISSLKHLSYLGFRTPAKLIKRLEKQSETIGF